MRAVEGLEQASTSLLRRIATAHGVAHDEATTHAEFVARLGERYQDVDGLRVYVEANLSERERAALLAARAGGGEIRGFLLARLLGADDEHAAAPLLDRGLLFRTFSPLGPHRGEVYAVPDEVLEVLAVAEDASAPAGTPGPPRAVPPPRDEWLAGEPSFSLFALASFLRRQGESGRGQANQRRDERSTHFQAEVGAAFVEPGGRPGRQRWRFLRDIAAHAGLLKASTEGGEQGVVTEQLVRLLSSPPLLSRRIWQAYLRDRDWHDLMHSGALRGEELAEQVDPPALRAAAIDALRRLPAGEWIFLVELSEWLRGAIPTFLREQLDARSLSLTDPSSGGTLWEEGSWARIEAPLIRYLCLGPLFWLGVVGTEPSGTLVAVGTLGRALLQGSEPPRRRPRLCAWEDGGRALLAPAQTDLGALLRAELYLSLVERGRPSRYELRLDRVARALDHGGSIAECQALLEQLTGADLPPAVSETLAAWEGKQGTYRLRPSVLLESASPEDQAALGQIDELRPLLRGELGPTTIEVPASQAARVAELLRRAGHLPRVDAALRLMAGRRAYAALVDEQALEFLLVSLLAFRAARPEQLAQLEGAHALLDRLEELFPPDRLRGVRAAASRLAGDLAALDPGATRPRRSRRGAGSRRSPQG